MQPPTIEEIIASPNLPSLPAVTIRVIELVQDPCVSLRLLADAVSSDAPLTSKLLKQANSSFYGRPRTVSKLTEAFMVLGLGRVKTLALGFSLVDGRRGQAGGFDYTAFWRRSLAAGVGARLLASRLREVDEEEAFLGGLLNGLGVLALNEAIGPRYHQLFAQARGDCDALLGLESEALGFDHAELGGRLGEQWNLPRNLTAALRWTAEPGFAHENERDLVRCASAGSAAADILTCETPGPALIRYRDRCHQWFDMTPGDADQLLSRIQADTARSQPLLDLPDADEPTVVEILSRVETDAVADRDADRAWQAAEARAKSASYAAYVEWLQAHPRLARHG